MLCLPKRSMHHSLPELLKYSHLRDHDYPCDLPDMWLLNSSDLNPVDSKIWNVIPKRVNLTKVQDVSDLRQRLIDVWAGVDIYC